MKQLLFLLFLSVFAQSVTAQSDLLYQYSLDDGLPSSYAKQVLQLPSGEMLMATDNGLSLFNGYTFQSFSQADGLPSPYIKALFVDSKSKLWIGTNAGLCFAVSSDLSEGYKVFQLDPARGEFRILALFEDSKQRLWAASDDFFYVIENDQVQKIGFPAGTTFTMDFVRSFEFAEDQAGGIWITTLGSGLWYLSSDLKTMFKLPVSPFENNIRTIIRVDSERFMVGGNNALYELKVNAQKPAESKVRILNAGVKMANRISQSEEGAYFVATDGFGYLLYDLKSNTYRQPDVLKSPYIKDVRLDRQKNIWIACDDGIYLKPHTIFRNINTRLGLPNRYISKIIIDSRGRAFFSTYEGVFIQEKEGEKVRKLNQGDLFIRTMTYDEKSGLIYIITGTELYTLSLSDLKLSMKLRFPFKNQPESIFLSSDNKIWLPALSDLAIIDPVTNSVQVLSAGQGVSSPVYSVTEGKKGQMYIGGENRKLFLFQTDSGRLKEVNWSEYSLQPDSLARLDELMSDQYGRLWIGASTGLFILDPGKSVEKVSGDPSSPMDNIRFITLSKNEAWVGTNRFLFLTSLDGQGKITGTRVFKKRNGLESTSFSNRSSYLDSKNRIWMGTNIGVSFTTGGDISYQTPEVRLQSWRTSDQVFRTSGFQALDASTSSIAFEYYGIDYPATDLYYQTRIIGISENWSEPTTNRIFPISINGSGNYEFQVRASKEIGNWGPALSIPFLVETHWYISWWMILVYIIFIGGSVYLFILWRNKALTEKNLVLERTIQERTEAILKKDADLAGLLAEMDLKGKRIYEESLKVNENIASMTAGTVQQSSSISETTATMEELAQSNKFIEESALRVSRLAVNTQRVLENVNHQAKQNIDQMDKIRSVTEQQVEKIQSLAERAENIKKISLFIENVNDQTQLIAFNAAIEATLAGEIGRRFSVIADEIRNLSHEINQSTREIKGTINDMIDDMDAVVRFGKDAHSNVKESVAMNKEMAHSIGELNQAQSEVTTAATGISKSTTQQTIANSQMVTSLREIADTSNHMVQAIHSISKTSHELESIAKFFMEVKKEG